MKHFIPLVILLVVSFYCNAQSYLSIDDGIQSEIAKQIARNARFNDSDGTVDEGATWVHLQKDEDTLLISTIYASSFPFDQVLKPWFAKTLNKTVKHLLPVGINIFIRITFTLSGNNTKFIIRENERIEERIKSLKVENAYILPSLITINLRGCR